MSDENMETTEVADEPTPVKRKKKAAPKKKTVAKKKAAPKKKTVAKKKDEGTVRGAPAKHPQGKPPSATTYKRALKAAHALTRHSRASVATVAFEAGFDDESTAKLVHEVTGKDSTAKNIAALRRKHFRELNQAA